MVARQDCTNTPLVSSAVVPGAMLLYRRFCGVRGSMQQLEHLPEGEANARTFCEVVARSAARRGVTTPPLVEDAMGDAAPEPPWALSPSVKSCCTILRRRREASNDAHARSSTHNTPSPPSVLVVMTRPSMMVASPWRSEECPGTTAMQLRAPKLGSRPSHTRQGVCGVLFREVGVLEGGMAGCSCIRSTVAPLAA